MLPAGEALLPRVGSPCCGLAVVTGAGFFYSLQHSPLPVARRRLYRRLPLCAEPVCARVWLGHSMAFLPWLGRRTQHDDSCLKARLDLMSAGRALVDGGAVPVCVWITPQILFCLFLFYWVLTLGLPHLRVWWPCQPVTGQPVPGGKVSIRAVAFQQALCYWHLPVANPESCLCHR